MLDKGQRAMDELTELKAEIDRLEYRLSRAISFLDRVPMLVLWRLVPSCLPPEE